MGFFLVGINGIAVLGLLANFVVSDPNWTPTEPFALWRSTLGFLSIISTTAIVGIYVWLVDSQKASNGGEK